jgi:hypothetical protein
LPEKSRFWAFSFKSSPFRGDGTANAAITMVGCIFLPQLGPNNETGWL